MATVSEEHVSENPNCGCNYQHPRRRYEGRADHRSTVVGGQLDRWNRRDHRDSVFALELRRFLERSVGEIQPERQSKCGNKAVDSAENPDRDSVRPDRFLGQVCTFEQAQTLVLLALLQAFAKLRATLFFQSASVFLLPPLAVSFHLLYSLA